jgi:pilus assembly protein CpaE
MPDSRLHDSARALLVAPDRQMADELRLLFESQHPRTLLTVLGTYPSRATLEQCAAQGLDYCFLDTTSDCGAAFAAMSVLNSICPEAPVFALLRSNDPDLFLQCLRQGASGFLIQPFTAEQLRNALAKLSRLHSSGGAGGESLGRVYCVMPGKGACGATTVACHLAFALLLRQKAAKVLLADLDGLTGTLGFLLKLKSNYSFADALAHSGGLEQDVWKVLVSPCHGLDVLLSPESPLEALPDGADPTPILDYSRRFYDAVVLDTAGAYGDWSVSLARSCDDLLLVSTNELVALHAVQRAQAYLARKGLEPSKIRLIVNRYSNEVGLRREAIQTALQAEVFETLPSDYEAIQRSLMEGKHAPPTSQFGKAIAALARHLAGEERAEKKSSMFAGLFGKSKG